MAGFACEQADNSIVIYR